MSALLNSITILAIVIGTAGATMFLLGWLACMHVKIGPLVDALNDAEITVDYSEDHSTSTGSR